MRALIALLIAGCATTTSSAPKPGPRGLHASEHLDAADQHAEAARNSRSWSLDTTPGRETEAAPWMRSWDPAAEHDRIAALHRSKAAALQAQYEEACGSRPLAEVATSPLVRYGLASWNTSAGVIMYLSRDAGPPERLLADLKCHRAWMMLSPAGMDDCPLDLPGLQLDARGEGDAITVSLVMRDRRYVEELQRRVGHDLEKSHQLYPTGGPK